MYTRMNFVKKKNKHVHVMEHGPRLWLPQISTEDKVEDRGMLGLQLCEQRRRTPGCWLHVGKTQPALSPAATIPQKRRIWSWKRGLCLPTVMSLPHPGRQTRSQSPGSHYISNKTMNIINFHQNDLESA